MAVKKPAAPAAGQRQPRRDSTAVPPRSSSAPRGATLATAVLEYGIAALALVSLVFLWREAANTHFAADECFHVYLARWIATHGTLPRTIPELYSGIPYFYPPLFHLVGAVSHAIAGEGSLRYINVILLGVLFAVLFFVPGETRTARRWTVGLLAANQSFAVYAVRVYAETLASLLAVVTVLLLLRLYARPRAAMAAAVGVAAGLGVLAKQPGVLLPALFAVLAVVELARGERRLAALLALALAIAVAVALPYYVRNLLYYGSPFYPPVTTEAQKALDVLNTKAFSDPPLSFYHSAWEMAGAVITLVGLAALAIGAVWGPRDLRLGLLALSAGFVAVAPFIHRFEPRHLNPFIAVVAMLGAMTIAERVRRDRAIVGLLTVLVIVAGVVEFPAKIRFRSGLDQSPLLHEGYRALHDHVPAGARVLCLWTYDAFYHSGRPATWPIPWAPSADLLPLFTTTDPEVFLATLRSQGVDYMLIPLGKPEPTFSGNDFDESFVRCLMPLINAHRLKVEWNSRALAIVSLVR